MPELPEIETIRRKLTPKLTGQTLHQVTLRRKDLRFPIPRDLKTLFESHKVSELSRRAKYLIWRFDNGHSLFIHLGMSGRLFFTDPEAPLNKHDHLIFDFGDGLHLRFRDPRRFGFVAHQPTKTESQHKHLIHLGQEPLIKSFPDNKLIQKVLKSSASIKNLLMNAKLVVGVGNIYASEALHLARIHPEQKGQDLSEPEFKRLCRAVQSVLNQSISSGGTSFRDYVQTDGTPGLHKVNLQVYGRDQKSCLTCKHPIRKITQTSRSTFFCDHCQPLKTQGIPH